MVVLLVTVVNLGSNLSSQYDQQAATAQTFLSVLNHTIEESRQGSQDMSPPPTVQNEMSRWGSQPAVVHLFFMSAMRVVGDL